MLSSSTLSFKNNSRYSKKCTRSKCACLNEVISQQTFLVFQDVFMRSWSVTIFRLQDLFALQYVFQKRLSEVFARRLQDVFKKTSCNNVLKTSWKAKIRYTEDVFQTSSPRRTSSRRACKTPSRRVQENVLQLCLEDVLEDKNTLHWRCL